MLPFIAIGIVGWGAKKLYDSFNDDDEKTTYSNRSEKEAEAREHAKVDKKKRIKREIKAYKKQQMKRLKEKYDVDAEFNSATIKVDTSNNLFDSILILENETAEIIKLIGKLEVEKNERFN